MNPPTSNHMLHSKSSPTSNLNSFCFEQAVATYTGMPRSKHTASLCAIIEQAVAGSGGP